MRRIASIDIGGTKIAASVVCEDGQLESRVEIPTQPEAGFPCTMERLKEIIRSMILQGHELDGIGIGCPGPLNPLTGVIGDVGTLPTWQNGNLVTGLEQEFGLSVAVENDADAAALAEHAWGCAVGVPNYIYVTLSTGIGAGIVLGGKLYRGVDGSHPEVGHQLIDPSGPLCYCGLRGCWESLASGVAVESWVQKQQQHALRLTAREICEQARQEDKLALRAMARLTRYVGFGLANLVTLFSPDLISLGGGLMRSSDLFFERATGMVQEICTQVPVHKVRIVPTTLSADVGLLGAAQSWLHRHPSTASSSPRDVPA